MTRQVQDQLTCTVCGSHQVSSGSIYAMMLRADAEQAAGFRYGAWMYDGIPELGAWICDACGSAGLLVRVPPRR